MPRTLRIVLSRRLFEAFAVLAICLAALRGADAPAQDNPEPGAGSACQILRIVTASILERCGERLRSLTLSINEIRYAARPLDQTTFLLGCPIEPMCADEPHIIGWFMTPGPWQASDRGEPEVSEVLRSRPQAPSFPVCEAFDVKVADLAGRAVCYQFPDTGMAAIGVVVADDQTGLVLVFEKKTPDWAALRDQVLEKLPLFQARRASGDAGLIRWMK
jgi:hypothetical protein